jgi:hypothetical protein
MTRLRTLDIQEVDDEIKAISTAIEEQIGTSAGTRTLAHHPELVKAMTAFRRRLAQAALLDAPLKELVRLKLAGLNACRF